MKSRFAQEDDSTSPTIMAIARTEGYTVKTDIFQVEQISNDHPCWCWVLSLSTGTVLYSSCMDTTTTYSSSSQGSETNKELSNQVCTPPTATLGFFLSTTGASLCTGREPHFHTDDKFQKRSRNNVASKLLELHIAMGH